MDRSYRIAEAIEQVLPLRDLCLGDEYFYASLPLCVIDAVYSISVRYEGVREVVKRYCFRRNIPRVRPRRDTHPPKETQERIEAFCQFAANFGPERMAVEVFKNRQRTSAKNGILKADAVLRFAEVLRKFGIQYFQDLPQVALNPDLEQAIKSIPGQRSGVSLKYFWMLAGREDFIKPDRMILRFLQQALGRAVLVEEATVLLPAASEHLKAKYPLVTARLIDYGLWNYQRAIRKGGTDACQPTPCRATNYHGTRSAGSSVQNSLPS